MDQRSRIYVAGMSTLMGSALVRELRRQGYVNLLALDQEEPDLSEASAVDAFFARFAPEVVFLAGGRTAGIRGNQQFPADLMLNNLLVECHIVDRAFRHGVRQLLYLASSCCYPRACSQPMRVESLLTGPLEPTSEAYALAKLAGIGLCHAYASQHGVCFISVIPGDAFGPQDDFNREESHVVPALLRRMHEAKVSGAATVGIWGTGMPRRDFVFADDLADACITVIQRYRGLDPINVSAGMDLSIRNLAELLKDIVGFRGTLEFDTSRPDGMPFKVLDTSELQKLGWRPRTPLRDALQITYTWFLEHEQRRMLEVTSGLTVPGESKR
jgi:GDP-L-fucose synthase